MLMLAFVKWWYGRGWAELSHKTQKRLHSLAEMFSVGILLRTLFAPWKRIISYPGAGLEAHLRAMLDNLVSRVIGFFVRIIVLLTAGITFVVVSFGSVVLLVCWLFVPPAAIGLIVWGLV